MKLDLFIPQLFLPPPILKLMPTPVTPALTQLLARADFSVAPMSPGASWQYDIWGLKPPYPIAPLLAAHDGINLVDDAVMFAEPVHMLAQQKGMLTMYPARFLELEQQTSQTLIAHLNEQFSRDGLRFEAPAPDRWYVRCPPDELPVTTPANQARLGSLLDHQPVSPGKINWRAIQNEIQMLLFAHPINQEREALGKPVVSGVWFWGGGRTIAPARAAYDRVVANDPALVQLAKRADIKVETSNWQDIPRGEGNVFAAVDAIASKLADADLLAWGNEMEKLDREFFSSLLKATRNGEIERLTLRVPGNDNLMTFALTPRQLKWRWLRSPKSLTHFAEHA